MHEDNGVRLPYLREMKRRMEALEAGIPVACRHTVFTKEQRLAYKNIWEKLEDRRLAIRELDNGFQYRFPGDLETMRLIQEWVSMERLCCPFLTFAVIAGNVNEPVWLELTGNEKAKAFLRTEIQSKIDAIANEA